MASARILLNLKMKFSNFEGETIILPRATEVKWNMELLTKTTTCI